METKYMTREAVEAFAAQLTEEERSRATIEKYLRDVGQFAQWLRGRPVTKRAVAAWKEALLTQGCACATVNGKLTALDRFLCWQGWNECRVKHLKLQRKLFREPERELSQTEYERLVETAFARGASRTGILFITVEAVRQGKAEISLKGKIRTILIPGKLCRKLSKYAQKQKIASGEIFLTKSGKGMTRQQIWAEMKAVCRAAGVERSKVFPHNLRHLFARAFYKACRDVARLADVLGHSSIETTRIYLISTGAEHAKTLNQLRLVT